ncbi:MAG: tRNA (adenosine(37)-N6)-dimethylallyltransferase MiaA [Deltaproteobacteria bacterium]|nr:tRNA (adenosine(37)-N6)-dimethylallyltransferase MiaA [Deltaproteobacteria bacterium]
MAPSLIIICGPTASGKTKVSLALAKLFGGEVISADSQQVYRGMDIGTAKPTPEEQILVRHHLIDVATPDEQFHVGRYLQLADQAIADIDKRGRKVVVVGGTGLYITSLLYGLCEAPPRDEAVRQCFEDVAAHDGLDELYRRLMAVDPKTAATTHPHQRRRLIRALEVYELTGKPFSSFFDVEKRVRRHDSKIIGLLCDRKVLCQRIDTRVDQMLKHGWLEEVEGLVKRYGPQCPAFMAHGYRELVDYVQGKSTITDAAHIIKRNVRHYAKRQMTWFRGLDGIQWFAHDDVESMIAYVEQNI